jgi:hypothetical protein
VKRPSPAGLLVGLAFAIPVLIELRTVLVWLGFDVPLSLYAPVAILAVVAMVAGLWLVGEGNPSRA